MLTELTELSHKMKEERKATQSKLIEMYREPKMKGRKQTQINNLGQKEEINIQSGQNEKTRIEKIEEKLRNLQDILRHSNIRIIGVPEGEEEEQKIQNLFEQIMKENFPSLAKEIDF